MLDGCAHEGFFWSADKKSGSQPGEARNSGAVSIKMEMPSRMMNWMAFVYPSFVAL